MASAKVIKIIKGFQKSYNKQREVFYDLTLLPVTEITAKLLILNDGGYTPELTLTKNWFVEHNDYRGETKFVYAEYENPALSNFISALERCGHIAINDRIYQIDRDGDLTEPEGTTPIYQIPIFSTGETYVASP